VTSQNWFLLVDRRNAMAFFARSLIVPRRLLDKYRRDPLELAPDRLLFVRAEYLPGLTSDGVFASEQMTLLEVRGDLELHGPRFSADDGATVAVAPSGALSVQHVVTVHVTAEAEADELTARSYRNVDGSRLPVRASPALFSSAEGADLIGVWSWLRGLASVDLDESRIRHRECVAGALLLLGHGLRGEPRTFSDAADVIRRVLKSASDDAVSALVDGVAAVGWCTSPDDIALLRAVCERIAEQSGPEPPVAQDVLRDIESHLEGAGVRDLEIVRRQLARVLEITRGDRKLAPFRRPGGLHSIKALLLFLLRPEPESATSWRSEELNAEEEVILLNLLYAGLSRRTAGLPDVIRHAPVLERAAMDWVAQSVGDADIRAGRGGTLAVEKGSSEIALLIGGSSALSLPLEKSEVRIRLEGAEETDTWAISVVTRLEWDDCFETEVISSAAAVVANEKGIRVSFAGPVTIRRLLVRHALDERLVTASDSDLERAARDFCQVAQGL
jgi:hypothetical protein